MAETITQFCARVLGLLPFEPPTPKRGPRYGADMRCWLCGGTTEGKGWPQEIAIAPTFTQHNTAKAQDSDAVCQSCAALTRAETYQRLVTGRNLPIKLWTQAGWHSYSHYICDDGTYEAPVPSRMREILLNPPAGRWVLGINTTGKKHTLFRGAVAASRDYYPVQVDEETIWLDRQAFAACLAAFERLTAMGCSKDGVETGRYHPADVMRAGLALWRPAEVEMARWREAAPALVSLARIVAHSAKAMADAGLSIIAEPRPDAPQQPQFSQPSQMSLF